MMKLTRRGIYLIILIFIFGSCGLSDEDPADNSSPEYDFAYIEFFDEENLDWTANFSDYPDSLVEELNLSVSREDLKNAFSGDNHVLVLSGRNPHRDLFYFISRKFTDLESAATYNLSFRYEILVEVIDLGEDENLSDLYLKAGAVPYEPVVYLNSSDPTSNTSEYVLTADKGENEISGEDQIYNVRNIKESLKVGQRFIVTGETLNSQINVQTNSNGEFWVIFGIDSNTDAELSFAFNTMVVFFKKSE